MKRTLKNWIAFTTLGWSLGITAQAQPMGGMPWAQEHAGMGQHPAQIGKWHEKRLAALKAKLQLTPAQEGAWQTFEQAHRPSAGAAPLDHEALAKLKTPERLEAMQTRMSRMAEATRAFYTQLTPEQQKVFDTETLPPMRGGKKAQEQR
jgi:protein CpxP